MREKSFCDTMVSPSFFPVGGLHAHTADFLYVVAFMQQRAVLLKGFLCKGFYASRFGEFTQTVAKWRSGRTPPWSCFSVCFPVVLHRLTEHIPFNLSRNHLRFIICRWEKKKKHTDKQEEFFYLISLWSPARFWNVCALCSNWISLIIDCKNLSASSLLFFFLFIFPFSFHPFLFYLF